MTAPTTYLPKHFKWPANGFFAGTDDATPYLLNESIAIAVDVALATERPLLVSGPPGCGKTRLGEAMAAMLGWNFLRKTITSHTRLEELTAEVDHLRRLHDAQRSAHDPKALKEDRAYHKPGIFWWAFDAASAAARQLDCPVEALQPDEVRKRFPDTWRKQNDAARNCVLLIDEIDKAEPDLPNDLLEPLDRRSFGLPDGSTLTAPPELKLLTLITTNQERELPRAFLRRCVLLDLELPGKDDLVAIAMKHVECADEQRVAEIADLFLQHRKAASKQKWHEPGTSEFLDAIRADRNLAQGRDVAELWRHLKRAVLKAPEQAQE